MSVHSTGMFIFIYLLKFSQAVTGENRLKILFKWATMKTVAKCSSKLRIMSLDKSRVLAGK